MRIGICTGVENINKLEAMGFDYIEPALNAAVALSKEQFDNVKRMVDKSSIKCEAFNCFFPWDIKIVGPDAADSAIINEYIKRALERASLLGCRITVVGSGGARRAPEGWDMKRGLEQLAGVLRRIGEEAAQYGITVVVEPLNSKETNIVNSVHEGLQIVKTVNHSNVKLLADFYHMREERESMDTITTSGGFLKHLHIANSSGRIYPLNRYEDKYELFFKALKEAGYNERISIEASTNNFEGDAPVALALLRELCR